MKTLGFVACFSILSYCAVAQDNSNNGAQQISHPTRQLKSARPAKFSISNNKLNGEHVLYDNEGRKTKEGTFSNDRLIDGKVYIYNPNGTLSHVELYKNGEPAGKESK